MDLFAAGSETSAMVLTWTVLYLTVHQDKQEKLYNEIVKAVGTERRPQLADRQKYGSKCLKSLMINLPSLTPDLILTLACLTLKQ